MRTLSAGYIDWWAQINGQSSKMASAEVPEKKPVVFRDLTSTCREKPRERKKTSRKTRSKGHLCHRSAGIPPFSAWVEPASSSIQEAMLNAHTEEERLNKLIQDKTEKLREFQEGVRKRVKELERVRKVQQLDKSYEAVEMERNVVLQSSFPKKSCLAKRDTCVYRDTRDLIIRHTRGAVVHDHSAVNAATQLLDEHAQRMRKSARHARDVLSSKSKAVDLERVAQLPGGLWDEAPTKDHADVAGNHFKGQRQDLQSREGNACETNAVDYWMGPDEIKDISITDMERGNYHEMASGNNSTKGPEKNKNVHFEEDKDRVDRLGNAEKCSQSGRSRTKVKPTAIEQLIKPGKVVEETKKQCKGQMAMFRKLFMDIEREQVREKIRMKESRKKMEFLKVEKEIQRLEIEHREMELLKQQEIKAAEEEFLEKQKKECDHKAELQENRRHQKSKETGRYIEALRAILREKLQNKKIVLPPLCSCGPTVWDASPETCANNCVFYRNPKTYAKALASLLASSDLM